MVFPLEVQVGDAEEEFGERWGGQGGLGRYFMALVQRTDAFRRSFGECFFSMMNAVVLQCDWWVVVGITSLWA